MGKQQEILSFVLADSKKPLNLLELQDILLKLSATLKEEGITPYHFFQQSNSIFSFSLNHDLESLENQDAIRQNGKITISNRKILLDLGYKLDFFIQKRIKEALSRKELSQDTHREVTVLASNDIKNKSNTLFTIGYEGINIDSFLQKLLTNGIKKLVDVRKNPISRKFGFSKKILSQACRKVEIEYMHFPNLGIPSESRKSLKTQDDYDQLFYNYSISTLENTSEDQEKILDIIQKSPSALVCFESNAQQCHRLTLAKHLANKINIRILNI